MISAGHLEYATRIDQSTGKPYPAEGRRRVFISYKKSDNKLSGVRDIMVRKLLNIADIAVWYDRNLTAGVSYDSEIRSAISECDAVILLLTRDILESGYVWDVEVSTAREQKKGIIPIAFDISDADYATVEQKLGGAVHIIRYPSADDADGQSEGYEQSLQEFDDNLSRSVTRLVLDTDLNERIAAFFASGTDSVSMKDLTDQQKFYMGMGYLRGTGTDENIGNALPLLCHVAATYGSDPDTLRLKGEAAVRLYDHYYYTEKNYGKALEYAQLGADLGDAESMYRLGAMYYYGTGIPMDREKAAQWYAKAAEKGEPGAANDLGYMYYHGKGVAQDRRKAFELYSQAAEAGNARACHNLGKMYFKGEETEADKEKAFELYSKAADAGYVRAYSDLAAMYYYGDYVEKDGEKALEWYTKAADAGYLSAMNRIAEMNYYGNGTRQDSTAAYDWYAKSAELGSVTARRQLAKLFPQGRPSSGSDAAEPAPVEPAPEQEPAPAAASAPAAVTDAGTAPDAASENAAGAAVPAEGKAAAAPAKKSAARWLVPLIILLALIAAAVGVQLSGLFDLLGVFGLDI